MASSEIFQLLTLKVMQILLFARQLMHNETSTELQLFAGGILQVKTIVLQSMLIK